MTLDELKLEFEKDMPIVLTQLQSEAANTPVLYGKYCRYVSDFNRELTQRKNHQKTILRDRLNYYLGRGDDVCLDVYSSTELRTVLPGDEEVIKANTAVDIVENKIELCRSAMEAIRQRGFSISNVVNLRKLEAGE